MNNYSYRLGTSEHEKSEGSSAICGPRTWTSGGSIDPWTPWLRGPCNHNNLTARVHVLSCNI